MITSKWVEDYKLKAKAVLDLDLESEIASKNLAKMVLSLIKDREEIISKIEEMIEDRKEKQITEKEFSQNKLIKMNKLLGDVRSQIEIEALTELLKIFEEK